MTGKGARRVLVVFVILQGILLEFGAVYIAGHAPREGRRALFVVHVALTVASIALGAVAWWRAARPRGAAPGAGRGRTRVAVGLVAALWLAALRWSIDLPRPHLYLLVSLAITGLALLLAHVAAGGVGLLVGGSLALLAGNVLFGSQLLWPPRRPTEVVRWGTPATFRAVFPEEPPFLHAGGRLAPDLDVRMHSREDRRGVRLVTNAEGFRNRANVPYRPAPGELRVLNLGDSFSIGMQVDQEEFFGARLEHELARISGARSVTVLNAEISDPAYGLYHLQNHGAEYAPRIVVLGLCTNDMQQASFFCGPEAHHRLRLDGSGRIGPNPGYVPSPSDAFERLADVVYPRASSTFEPYFAERVGSRRVPQHLWRLQTLGQDLLAFDLVRVALEALPRASPPRLPTGYLRVHERRDGHMRLLDGCTNLGYFYRRPLAEVEALHEGLCELLEAHARTAREQGARFAVVVYPQRYQVNAADWRLLEECWNLDPADFDLRLYDRRLQEACARLGIPCCDLLDAFLAADRQLYLPEGDMHINRAGHHLAAREFAAFLARSGVLPDPASLAPGSAAFEDSQRIADPAPLRPRRFAATVDEAAGGLARYRLQPPPAGSFESPEYLLLRGGATSPTTVAYELAGRARTFRAKASVPPARVRSRLGLEVRVDGRRVWSEELRPRDPPVRLAIDLQGAQRLELVVAPRAAPDGRSCVVLGNPCFERASPHEIR